MNDKAPRYSDRFLGETHDDPNDANHRPAPNASMDVAENAGDDRREPRDGGTRLARWRAPIAVGIAFAIGAGGGAYGWDRWSDHTSTVASKSEVDLATVVTTTSYLNDEFQTSVEFINNGSYDVRITDPRFVDPSLTAGRVDAFVVPASGYVVRVIPTEANCDLIGDGAEWRPTGGFRVNAQPANGDARDVTVPGGSQDEVQLSTAGTDCGSGDAPPDVYFSAMTVSTNHADGGLGGDGTTDGGGGLVVVSHLVLGDGDVDLAAGSTAEVSPTAVLLDSVAAGYRNAFTVSTDPVLPATAHPGDSVSVTWHVDSCDAATTATVEDMTLTFSDHAIDASDVGGSLSADVPPELAIALMRLANEHCG